MKTLDEVLKELEERWIPDCETCPVSCVADNEDDCPLHMSIHYLKEYRSDRILWEAERKRFEDFVQSYTEARDKHQQAVKEMQNRTLDVDGLKEDLNGLWLALAGHYKRKPSEYLRGAMNLVSSIETAIARNAKKRTWKQGSLFEAGWEHFHAAE